VTDQTPPRTFEENLSELEAIVREMESGELPLHTALEKFERGIRLSRESQQALEKAEQKVRILLNEKGEDVLTDYTPPTEE
tara:strand:- start:13 stop:255 length:243 start_codon:yes stop_codon:yes gene_type:complete